MFDTAELDDKKQWSTKYRSQSLGDFLAPASLKEQVGAIIKNGNINSLLITGHTGGGKTTLGRIIAYAVNGLPYGKPHPDITEVDVGSKRGIDDIRALIEASRYLPEKRKRVFILDECHHLGGPAATAFLKPLEEPSPSTMYILCTNEPEKLLPTIINRCMPIHLDLPPQEELVKMLASVAKKEKAFLKDSILDKKRLFKAIVEGSGGSPRPALQLLQTAAVNRGSYKRLADLIKGPLLKTPTIGIDKAAIKILLSFNKIYTNGKGTLKPITSAMTEVENTVLLNRMINLSSSYVMGNLSGVNVPSAWPLIKTAREVGVDLSVDAMSELLELLVNTKQRVGDFAVDPSVLLLNAIVTWFREFTADGEED